MSDLYEFKKKQARKKTIAKYNKKAYENNKECFNGYYNNNKDIINDKRRQKYQLIKEEK